MNIKVTADTTKIEKLLEKVKAAESRILSKFISEGGPLVKTEMQLFAPVKTGFLRRSIIFRKSEKEKGRFFVVPRAIYAKKMERKYGFVKLTFFSVKEKVKSLIEKLIKEFYGKT